MALILYKVYVLLREIQETLCRCLLAKMTLTAILH